MTSRRSDDDKKRNQVSGDRDVQQRIVLCFMATAMTLISSCISRFNFDSEFYRTYDVCTYTYTQVSSTCDIVIRAGVEDVCASEAGCYGRCMRF